MQLFKMVKGKKRGNWWIEGLIKDITILLHIIKFIETNGILSQKKKLNPSPKLALKPTHLPYTNVIELNKKWRIKWNLCCKIKYGVQIDEQMWKYNIKEKLWS